MAVIVLIFILLFTYDSLVHSYQGISLCQSVNQLRRKTLIKGLQLTCRTSLRPKFSFLRSISGQENSSAETSETLPTPSKKKLGIKYLLRTRSNSPIKSIPIIKSKTTSDNVDIKKRASTIIDNAVSLNGLYLREIVWSKGSVEVVVSADRIENVGPELSVLENVSNFISNEFSNPVHDLSSMESFEVTVSSPGIGKELTTDRDFITFKGFDVVVTTTTQFKGRNVTRGSLIQRTSEKVVLGQMGKLVKIPRDIVESVRFPDSPSGEID